jgi:hypothetical protein
MARRQARFSDGNAQLIAIITGWTADEWASVSPPQGGFGRCTQITRGRPEAAGGGCSQQQPRQPSHEKPLWRTR